MPFRTTSSPGLFPQKNGWDPPHPFFEGKALGTRLPFRTLLLISYRILFHRNIILQDDFIAEINVNESINLSPNNWETANVKPLTANRGLPFAVRWRNLDLVGSLIRQTKNAKRACSLAIDHLRFPKRFPFKTRLSAKPFL